MSAVEAVRVIEVGAGFEDGEQVIEDREFAEYRFFLWQVAEAEARAAVHRHMRDVVAEKRDRSGIGGDQSGDHVEGCGFTRTVRA